MGLLLTNKRELNQVERGVDDLTSVVEMRRYRIDFPKVETWVLERIAAINDSEAILNIDPHDDEASADIQFGTVDRDLLSPPCPELYCLRESQRDVTASDLQPYASDNEDPLPVECMSILRDPAQSEPIVFSSQEQSLPKSSSSQNDLRKKLDARRERELLEIARAAREERHRQAQIERAAQEERERQARIESAAQEAEQRRRQDERAAREARRRRMGDDLLDENRGAVGRQLFIQRRPHVARGADRGRPMERQNDRPNGNRGRMQGNRVPFEQFNRREKSWSPLPEYATHLPYAISPEDPTIVGRAQIFSLRPQVVSGCLNCSGDHKLYQCPALNGMILRDRWYTILAMGVCLKCFYPGHSSKTCRIQGNCPKCRNRCDVNDRTEGAHNSVICPRGYREQCGGR